MPGVNFFAALRRGGVRLMFRLHSSGMPDRLAALVPGSSLGVGLFPPPPPPPPARPPAADLAFAGRVGARGTEGEV